MHKQLMDIIGQCPYKVHAVIENYKTGEVLLQLREDEPFSSASMIKVPMLLAVLAYLQQTDGHLQQQIGISADNMVDFSVLTEQQQTTATLHELLLWMIITSDNTATNACIDYLGMAAFNAYFREIGLHHTRLQRKMMDVESRKLGLDNVTTAGDMRYLFRQLYNGRLLAGKWHAAALDILCRQRSHESLKRYLVDNVKMAHKTGGLDTVDHDAGIVFTETGDYFIGIFMTDVTDNDRARQQIGTISKMVYTHYTK